MLCQSCQKRQANTHIKTVVNGELTEMMLCQECAAKLGYTNVFNHMFDIGSLMSGFMGEPLTAALATEQKCPKCGSTFSQISKSGRVGCSKCYEVFYDRLLPSIKRIHGNTVHTGKHSNIHELAQTKSAEKKPQALPNRIDELTKQMQQAVVNQEFEKAAELRDKINALKSQQGGNN